jgi:3-methylfumaryl-CoA hydratase
MTDAPHEFSDWIGRTETVHDGLSVEHARAAAAMFDDANVDVRVGAPLQPLWNWFFFLSTAQQSALDVDGHPKRGGFFPPIPFPRRMFAGSRLQFHRPLLIGAEAAREGVIRNVVQKSGRSGSLAFVTVGYRYLQNGVLCIEEEQDIVYRESGARIQAPVSVPFVDAPSDAWTQTVTPDARLLFRFSALTFNAHRIHYDRPYAEAEEGYPGLVVHGPLTAMLLCNLVRANTDRRVSAFSFRGLSPLFDLAPFRLIARPADADVALSAEAPDGSIALTATATLD